MFYTEIQLIRELLLGMSCEEFASYLNVDTDVVRNWENTGYSNDDGASAAIARVVSEKFGRTIDPSGVIKLLHEELRRCYRDWVNTLTPEQLTLTADSYHAVHFDRISGKFVQAPYSDDFDDRLAYIDGGHPGDTSDSDPLFVYLESHFQTRIQEAGYVDADMLVDWALESTSTKTIVANHQLRSLKEREAQVPEIIQFHYEQVFDREQLDEYMRQQLDDEHMWQRPDENMWHLAD